MVSTRSKRLSSSKTLDSEQSHPNIFQSLLSAIESPEGLEPSLLKCLYCLLVRVSSNPPLNCSMNGGDSNYWDTEIGHYRTRVTFKDVCSLSNVLFKELRKRFEPLLSASLLPDMWTSTEELNLLLRCCMVILNLLVSEQYLLFENGQVLVAILRKLSSLALNGGNERNTISFEKSISREYKYGDNDFATAFKEDIVASFRILEPSDPRLPFLCTTLVVFVDELLVHGQLREYFKLMDSVSSTSEMLFMHHASHGDIGSVMELISTHFFLSFIDEQAFESSLKRLFCPESKNCTSFELSLTAAVSLFLNPITLSAPKLLQSHIISLVCKAIGKDMCLEKTRPDRRLMGCYLSAFERSIVLYTKHMSLTCEGGFSKSSTVKGNVKPSFESYTKPTTRNKINQVTIDLDNSWRSNSHRIFVRTRSNLITSSIAYIKENQSILDTSYGDEIVSILSSIILGTLSSHDDDHAAMNTYGDASPQDLCLLASTLKLMSNSLLQIVWCLRHGGDSDCPRTLKNFCSCKEYDSIAGIVSCFEQPNLCLPIQKVVREMMESQPTRHNKSKMMLLHFSGLLSFSFYSGIDFLVKGCLLMVMSAMNLFVFEGGNLEAVRCFIDSGSKYFSSGLPCDNVREAVVDQRSSTIVASKFQKIKTRYLSGASLGSRHRDGKEATLPDSVLDNNVECVFATEEETSNGEIFLKCVIENSKKPSDFDDLADFIECKKGKSYSGWLKDRQKFRKWKGVKMAVLRWEKKKKTWKYMKGK